MPKYPVAKIVGSKIKRLRKEHGLTGTELAAYLHVSQQQFSRYERGVNRIDIDSLVIIANFLKVSIHYFFEDISSFESIDHSWLNSDDLNSNLPPEDKNSY
ncbi:helix-turn-helix domain-containing protein [Providencia rettgeri]|uniref:helix-turn-helix domain-containing protein n=1 Tax=Providencia sp. TaxID=589 RepID=UPI0024AB1A4C|nr:helix-turn-helix transcriptional regulator [Providencia rettgeri]